MKECNYRAIKEIFFLLHFKRGRKNYKSNFLSKNIQIKFTSKIFSEMKSQYLNSLLNDIQIFQKEQWSSNERFRWKLEKNIFKQTVKSLSINGNSGLLLYFNQVWKCRMKKNEKLERFFFFIYKYIALCRLRYERFQIWLSFKHRHRIESVFIWQAEESLLRKWNCNFIPKEYGKLSQEWCNFIYRFMRINAFIFPL